MREKYNTLSLTSLRDIAKARGIKRVTGVKKADLIDSLCALDEKENATSKEKDTSKEKGPSKEKGSSKENGSSKEKNSSKEFSASKKTSTDKTSENKPSPDKTIEKAPSEPVSEEKNKSDKETKALVSKTSSNDFKSSKMHKSHHIIQISGNAAQKASLEQHKAKPALESHKQAPKKEVPLAENEASKDSEFVSETTPVGGIIEILSDGFGFIRSENYLPGESDIYIAPATIRKYGLRTGDILSGFAARKSSSDKFAALVQLDTINGYTPEESLKRYSFQKMTPIFPNQRLGLEYPGAPVSMRIMDLIDPIGKGQRGMIVSPPKAGKTTLLKDVAKSIKRNFPDMHIIILLIDERPEEVTDIKESIEGPNVEVIYSTFDELPEHHTRVAEMTIEHARRLVEHNKDVTILIDSITRLTRAYNQVVPPSGRTLSGGLDPAALHMPKRFFGAARNMREGGSLTILATALIETGSKMDDVVYEEFKGTGNMEMILDRKLQEKRIFPAINIAKSSTRREDLLLNSDELAAVNRMRKSLNGLKADEAADQILNNFSRTRSNKDFITLMNRRIF